MLAVILLPTLWPQSTEHLTVGQPQKVVGKRNDAVQATVPVSVQGGFHVNNNAPLDATLIPLSITWTSLGALEGGQVTYPKAEKIAVGDEQVLVFTGKFDLKVNFKVSAKAPAGPGIVSGKLRYQACNDRSCFPPKNVDISVPYQVQ
jgi:DsbC/DsbD-like thiol-disulfide interchange protein